MGFDRWCDVLGFFPLRISKLDQRCVCISETALALDTGRPFTVYRPIILESISFPENVALSKPAQSSPLTGISGPPSVVVNGNTGTTFISEKVTSDAREQNCIASKARTTVIVNEEAESLLTREKRMAILPGYVVPWWSVDLQSDVPVRGVVIYRSNPGQFLFLCVCFLFVFVWLVLFLSLSVSVCLGFFFCFFFWSCFLFVWLVGSLSLSLSVFSFLS